MPTESIQVKSVLSGDKPQAIHPFSLQTVFSILIEYLTFSLINPNKGIRYFLRNLNFNGKYDTQLIEKNKSKIFIKNFFPYTEISYVYQGEAYLLIKANPNIDRHFPLFRNLVYPSKRDCKSLKNVMERYDFDLIFNFCPYFSTNIFKSVNSSVIHPIRFIANIIRAYASDNHKAQVAFQMNKYAAIPHLKFLSYMRFSYKRSFSS